jgi:hypothetical protein
LYHSPNIIRAIKTRLRRVEHVARIEEGRSVFKILIGSPTGKRRSGRTILHIIMDLKEIGLSTKNSAQDRDFWRVLVNLALNIRVP